MEPHQAAPALGHGRRQIVVPAFVAAAAIEGQGPLVTAQERLERLGERELDRQEARVAGDHHEGVDGPAEVEDIPELPPVHLERLVMESST